VVAVGAYRRVRPLAPAAAVLASALILATTQAAPEARAGSIVFTDRGNVWLMRDDGTGRRRITRGGGWSSPSQANKA
jgi:hypothetical protein